MLNENSWHHSEYSRIFHKKAQKVKVKPEWARTKLGKLEYKPLLGLGYKVLMFDFVLGKCFCGFFL